ncbi:MAG: 30S ribosomal protein S21 [bacterium]|nr:30S ribosomal protein S21 [bacterium]
MITVTRKDPKEPLDNMLRRFSRKVQQSGNTIRVKQNQYFEKPISRRERREKAIIRNERRDEKYNQYKIPQR